MVSVGELEYISDRLLRNTDVGLPIVGNINQYPFVTALAFMLGTSIVAGIVEEAAFRGVMQIQLQRWVSSPKTYFLVALYFSFFHLLGRPVSALISLPAWFLISYVFSWLVSFTSSIWPAIVCHAGIDIVEISWYWKYGAPIALAQTGLDHGFWIAFAIIVISGIVTAIAYKFLRRSIIYRV